MHLSLQWCKHIGALFFSVGCSFSSTTGFCSIPINIFRFFTKFDINSFSFGDQILNYAAKLVLWYETAVPCNIMVVSNYPVSFFLNNRFQQLKMEWGFENIVAQFFSVKNGEYILVFFNFETLKVHH